MPRRTVSALRSFRSPAIRGGSYSFDDPYARQAAAGASELDRAYHMAAQQQHEESLARYRDAAEAIREARERRLEAEAMAKAERRLKYETMAAQAIPELYKIDPADPQAQSKVADIVARYPQLIHNEKDLPSLTQHLEQHARLTSEATRQRDAIEARKAAAEERVQARKDAAELLAEQKRQHDQERKDDLNQREQERRDSARESKLNYARGHYEAADAEAKQIRQNIADTQALIDEQQAKPKRDDKDEFHLNRMVASVNKDKEKLRGYESKMKGLVASYPELDPTYDPDKAKPVGGHPAPAPTNPNVIDTAQPDVPDIRKTAPVSGGTATPSGTMAPLSPSQTGESTEALQDQPVDESQVPTAINNPAAPVASVAPPTPTAPAEVHPYEGKRVRQKSTNKMGTFVNGVFVPDEEEALQDQPTPGVND